MRFGSSECNRAVEEARRYLEERPVYLDTETTGTGAGAEVIEIGLVDHDGRLLFESLVKPLGVVEEGARRVHGISHEMLQNAPTWAEIWPLVETALRDRRVGIYNSEFDLRMMKQSHKKYWMTWRLPEERFFCIMKLYARFYGDWDRRRSAFRYQSLDMAGMQCRIQLRNTHRAKDDALLAHAILAYMAAWKPGD